MNISMIPLDTQLQGLGTSCLTSDHPAGSGQVCLIRVCVSNVGSVDLYGSGQNIYETGHTRSY